MKGNTKVFLMMLLLVIGAGTLAFFIRTTQERIYHPFVPPPVQKATSTPRAPALVVIYAPTSTLTVVTSTSLIAAPREYKSKDGMMSVVVRGDAIKDGVPVYNTMLEFYGTSTVSEHRIDWHVIDTTGLAISQGFVYVSSTDAGVSGSFSADAGTFTQAPRSTSGTLEVFEPSSKDGTPLHTVRIPIIFNMNQSH